MRWPWVSRALYLNVQRQLVAERRRAEALFDDLRLETAQNRLAERHWANQFLRKMNAYPQQPVKEDVEKSSYIPKPVYDPGELAAVVEEAQRLGVSTADARAMFANSIAPPSFQSTLQLAALLPTLRRFSRCSRFNVETPKRKALYKERSKRDLSIITS